MECYRRGCNKRSFFKVTKKSDLSHKTAFYCADCVKDYRDSDEGKKYFNVEKTR